MVINRLQLPSTLLQAHKDQAMLHKRLHVSRQDSEIPDLSSCDQLKRSRSLSDNLHFYHNNVHT